MRKLNTTNSLQSLLCSLRTNLFVQAVLAVSWLRYASGRKRETQKDAKINWTQYFKKLTVSVPKQGKHCHTFIYTSFVQSETDSLHPLVSITTGWI